MNKRRNIWLALAWLIIPPLAGCSHFRATRPEAYRPPYARMSVIEFNDRTNHRGVGERFSRLLTQEISWMTEGMDAVMIPAVSMPELRGRDPVAEGRLPLSVITRLRRDHAADIIIIGAVDNMHPYWKPRVSVSMIAIDARDGEIIFRMTEHWDAGAPWVRKEINRYYKANRERDECRFGPDLFTLSPNYFLLFTANNAARRMLEEL